MATETDGARARGAAPVMALGAAICLAGLAAVTAAAVPSGEAMAASHTSKVVVSAMTISGQKVLVSNGEALYTLTPSATACDAQCLGTWPALALPTKVHKASAGKGVTGSALGVTTGPGGIRQVTYHGQPLYWFSGDSHGQVNGNLTDQWGKWTAAVVSGSHASQGGSTPTTGSTNTGSGGASF